MNADDFSITPRNGDSPSLLSQDKFTIGAYKLLIIACLLVLGALVVYATGGTGYAYPYVLLLPIILTAGWFGFLPAILCACAAGFALGPFMPLNVSQGVMQSTHNWLVRIAFFVLIGAFTGFLFEAFRSATRRLLAEIQLDRDTGLPNKAALNEDLIRVLAQARSRKASEQLPAVILIRMQDLWEIIDAMGSGTAEKVVQAVAEKIAKALDVDHRVYRFSNSELLVLFLAESPEQVDTVATRVRQVGEEESEVGGIPLRVQLVSGSYFVDRTDVEPGLVINRAKTGLHAAIDSSGFYRRYDASLDRKTAARVQLVSRVREGLANNQFTLFYQPKLCLKTGQHMGSEGLLRWFYDDGQMVLPGIFIPKVESTTLIEPVTRFVIRKACEDMEQFNLSAVSVNFSTKNLRDDALIQNLGEIVSLYGVDPSRLEIEITEGALIDDPAHAKQSIDRLRQQGFKVSLDDFGTGYSSFQYLSQLSLTGLKIDRAFVTNLEDSHHARTVLSSMIKMAHALELTVTVEGVETKRQQELVAQMGADLVQGFYHAKPMAIEDYRAWERERRVDSYS